MSYYVKAYRKGKVLNIPLEEKHQYFNGFTDIVWKEYSNTANAEQDSLRGSDVAILHKSEDLNFVNGTGESNIVGNKIQVCGLDYTIIVRLNYNAITDKIPHDGTNDFFERFRIMVVKFEVSMTAADIAEWFRSSYIYFNTNLDPTRDYEIQSVHSSRLRESTRYTGKFKILYDSPFRMTGNETVKAFTFSLRPNKNLTISEAGFITDEDFLYCYTFILGPANYSLDLDARSYEMVHQQTFTDLSPDDAKNVHIAYNIKYSFHDLN